ncbi:MAG: MotA/TolQ/ExbB proton channel family protein [Deltaproteobacteria bacterium]|nr:MotA/TolQ/ExbB proton channel family protein [Deltaproteobacteria bacterium]MBW2399502.1 MotA/TolQ/ExbB proton channel family protein [Deltaproteobacteria bacterium]MBW2665236.1 MotA/TolQ/ExbB proton channel family protein [Deltaproteobacteria bacterium]
MDANAILELLHQGGLTVYPLGLGSVVALAILMERVLRFRGLEAGTRSLTRETIESLVRRDLDTARSLCEKSKLPVSNIYLEAMRWKNIALEDLERVISTSRMETSSDMKRGVWVIGTIGSLAPYVGLFGTVIGIMKSFADMAEHGAGGFEVVAAGISEALVATGAGLFVAIVALAFFNYLQVRVGAISSTYTRSCERFLQALLYVESASNAPEGEEEMPSGRLVPA